MNKRSLTVLISGFLVVLLLSVGQAAPKIDTLATLSGISGDVLVQKGGAGDWLSAGEGELVKTGDVVKTGAKSGCVITWSQGNVVKLSPFSMMRIDRLEKNPAARAESSELNLWTGKMHAKAKKLSDQNSNFEIRTPTAIAGVRGTKLSVEVGADESTNVQCFTGEVLVKGRAGGEVTLRDKQKTTVSKDQAPTDPSGMDQEDEQDFEQVEEIADATLDIMQPVGNLETDKSPVTVKGKTDPGNTITVNAKLVTAGSDGTFEASVGLNEGVNQIKIEAVNKNGKSITKTRVIKYRPPAPAAEGTIPGEEAAGAIELSISTPRDGLVTRDAATTVSGSVTPGAEVSANGIVVQIPEGAGQFNASVNLIEGENIITVTARKDSASQSMTRTVYKDTTAPMLIINQPGASFGLDSGVCMLAGDGIQCSIIGQTEFDAALTINGMRYTVEADGSFQQTVMLTYDQTTIDIASTDAMGNRANAILTRVIDRAKVGYVEVSVSPGAITADGQSSAAVTVTTLNLLREPVDAVVTLSATGGGYFSNSASSVTVQTAGGTGSEVFRAGTGSITSSVTITATGGGLSGTTVLILNPDRPPAPGTDN